MQSPPVVRAGLAGSLVVGIAIGVTSTAPADDGFRVIDVPSANPKVGVENSVLTPSATQTSVTRA
jgi:hypothetical protein